MALRTSALALAFATLCTSCIFYVGDGGVRRRREPTPAASASLSTSSSAAICEGTVSASALLAHIGVLASDDFEGRLPGTKGEEKTVDYLVRQCRQIGLSPGNPDGTYVQEVPLVGFRTSASGAFKVGERELPLAIGTDTVALTRWIGADVEVASSPVVFVGYGVVAPEYGWDDYKGVDVRGKTIVMLINDPPVTEGADATKLDGRVFGGKAMTYYGRWTYKYEIAAEKGAAAAILVHQTEQAAYPWSVVLSSWNKENFDIAAEDHGRSRAKIESWITLEKAEELFQACKQDFRALEKLAATREFRPVELGASASFHARNESREVRSRNVVARIEGLSADEHVVYTAHWDHLGRDAHAESEGKDGIKNGAVDNASGCAGMLEIARVLASRGEKPARSLLFLWVTAEEQGLLGSKWYATHPLWPLERTLANVNMDSLNVWGPTQDIVCVGFGQSTLDDELTHAAQRVGRRVKPDPSPEKGSYYRSDHFEFAKVGVPSLYADGGEEVIGRPEGWGHERGEEFTRHDYHQPSDEPKAEWDLSGAARDMELLAAIGWNVAQGSTWPAWKDGSEFKARREKQLADAAKRR